MQNYDQFPTKITDPDYTAYEEAAEIDPRYPVAAFCYLAKCLKRLLERKSVENGGAPSGHVSGKDVCMEMRDSLLRDFGHTAQGVLAQWNIFETSDFGNIVYDLIGIGLLSASPQDSRTDFDDIFDFAKELNPPLPGENNPDFPWEPIP